MLVKTCPIKHVHTGIPLREPATQRERARAGWRRALGSRRGAAAQKLKPKPKPCMPRLRIGPPRTFWIRDTDLRLFSVLM
ncbi:hypothetical protein SAMN02745121_03832 [Nannocystis exedens]|uniref:Uncharacterized protein n=1 Tax=Nannocystis exedens TaxID=54 RepID=A0A1I1ZPV7_9BACT|nr:hypothetical protein NAEX_08552 [Nannocystis exedens]SFE32380.1 hypothetical protein SAMN02745121_03832 [Nannocystis exedens]